MALPRLVPRQNSSGAKGRLGRVTKQEGRYLRQLLFIRATSMLGLVNKRKTPDDDWGNRPASEETYSPRELRIEPDKPKSTPFTRTFNVMITKGRKPKILASRPQPCSSMMCCFNWRLDPRKSSGPAAINRINTEVSLHFYEASPIPPRTGPWGAVDALNMSRLPS